MAVGGGAVLIYMHVFDRFMLLQKAALNNSALSVSAADGRFGSSSLSLQQMINHLVWVNKSISPPPYNTFLCYVTKKTV